MSLLTWDIGRRSCGSHWGLQCTLVLEGKIVSLGNVSLCVHVFLANGKCCRKWWSHNNTKNITAFFLCHSIDAWIWFQNQLHKVFCKIHILNLMFYYLFVHWAKTLNIIFHNEHYIQCMDTNQWGISRKFQSNLELKVGGESWHTRRITVIDPVEPYASTEYLLWSLTWHQNLQIDSIEISCNELGKRRGTHRLHKITIRCGQLYPAGF